MGCMPSYSRQEWCFVLSLAAITFTTAVCASLQAPFYPKEAEKKGATAQEYGLVFGIFELTGFLVSPLFGRYMVKIGPTFLLKCGIMVSGISTILFGLLDYVDDHWTFISISFLLRIIEAVGTAAVLTADMSVTVHVFADSFARVITVLEVTNGLGYMVGPTVGGYLFQIGGFKCPFIVVGVLVLIAGVFVFFTLPKLDGDNGILQAKVPILSVLRILPVSLAAISIGIEATSIGFLTSTLEPHIRPFNLSPTMVGVVFIIAGVVYSVTAPLIGILCDKKFNNKFMIIFGSLCVIVGFMLVGPLPFTPFNTTLLGVCIGQVFDGLGMSFIFIPSFVEAISSAIKYGLPDDIATYAMVSGIYNSAFSLGAFIGPSISGILFDYFGFRKSTLFIIASHVFLMTMVSIFTCMEGWYEKRFGIPLLSTLVDSEYDQPHSETDKESHPLVLHTTASIDASTDKESHPLVLHTTTSIDAQTDTKLAKLKEYNTCSEQTSDVYTRTFS